jgi:hypothetical protein
MIIVIDAIIDEWFQLMRSTIVVANEKSMIVAVDAMDDS